MKILVFFLLVMSVSHSVCAMEKVKKQDRYNPRVYLEEQKLHQGPITRAELDTLDFTGKKVMDAGCGPGHHCKYMIDKGSWYIYGIDSAPEMITFAKKKYSHPDIDYAVAKMEDFKANAQGFNIIISSFAFMYVPIKKQKKVLQFFYNSLHPGGTLLIIMAAKQPDHPFVGALQSLYQKDKDKWGKLVGQVKSEAQQVFSTEEYKAMLKEVGFTSDAIEEGVTERSEPLSVQDSKQFEKFTNSWARGAYPALTAMSNKQYAVFKREFYNAYYENRKKEDSSFDRNKPFFHPYKLLVMKVRKEA